MVMGRLNYWHYFSRRNGESDQLTARSIDSGDNGLVGGVDLTG